MNKFLKNVVLALAFLGATTAFAQTKNINLKRSFVEWEGKKITGSSHEGTLKFKSGSLEFDKKKNLIGGTFVVDMSTLTVTDLSGEGKMKLEGHLKNEDFFDVQNHKEATLVFKNIQKIKEEIGEKEYRITADLTIKGITHPVTFDLEVKKNKAETDSFGVDRTKYGVKYGSGNFFSNLGDNVIRDYFELDVNLYF